MTATDGTPRPSLEPKAHRALAVDLYNHVQWLLERAGRSPGETDELIHAAHASRWHWARAEGSTTANLARGEWLCARVYATLGRGEAATWHASRAVEQAEAAASMGESEPWDLPAAYEAMARALAVAGQRAAAEGWRDRARIAAAAIGDAEDRQVIEQDLSTLPL